MNHDMIHNANPNTAVKTHFMSNFETRSTLMVAALVLSAATSAQAQTAAPSAASPGSPPSQMSPSATPQAEAATPSTAIPQNKVTSKDLDGVFLQADANKDGKLDRKEAESLPVVLQHFERLDSNHDGFISRVEFSKVAGS